MWMILHLFLKQNKMNSDNNGEPEGRYENRIAGRACRPLSRINLLLLPKCLSKLIIIVNLFFQWFKSGFNPTKLLEKHIFFDLSSMECLLVKKIYLKKVFYLISENEIDKIFIAL